MTQADRTSVARDTAATFARLLVPYCEWALGADLLGVYVIAQGLVAPGAAEATGSSTLSLAIAPAASSVAMRGRSATGIFGRDLSVYASGEGRGDERCGGPD